MKCAKCLVWELIAGDYYCSWCGKEVFQQEVRKTPIRFYVNPDDPDANRVAYSPWIIKNLSHTALTLTCVSATPWLVLNSAHSFTVNPNSPLHLMMGVDVQKLEGMYLQEGQLVLHRATAQLPASKGFEPISLTVQVWPLPTVVMHPLIVFSGNPMDEAEIEMEVYAEMTVESIVFDPPYLVYEGKEPLDLGLDDQYRIPVQVKLPPQSPVRQALTYQILVEGLRDPIGGQCEVLIKKPPVLQVMRTNEAHAFRLEILPNSEESFQMSIYNPGEEVLRIEGMQISPVEQPGNSTTTIKPEKEKFQIEPNGQATLWLSVCATVDARPGDAWFKIVFQSNDPIAEHNQQNLQVSVNDRAYADYVALDFGTTDSAAAIFESSAHAPINIPLERGVKDPKIYSNIFFKGFPEDRDPPFIWCIGDEAKALGPSDRERFVKAIKIRSGINHLETIAFTRRAFSRKLEAEEIIRFILMDLLTRIKAGLRARPTRFILSVPTRFTLRRKEILKETFFKAAQSLSLPLDGVEMLDESLAAGLFYILFRGPRDEIIRGKENYTMMILDFGGGTTDITIFKVKQHLGPEGFADRIDEIEVIGAWGDSTLGGESITAEIAQLLAERFLGRPIDPEADLSEIRKLEDEAEEAKIVLSELLRLGDKVSLDDVLKQDNTALRSALAYLSLSSGLIDEQELRVVLEAFKKNQELNVESSDFRDKSRVKIGAKEVVAIFDRRLQRLKGELGILMQRIQQPQMDVLLLAGQSSQFPLVAETFKGLAANIDFVKDENNIPLLKECVSRGALYYSFYLKRKLRTRIIGANRVWTRIGRMGFDLLRGRVFEELIPWRSEYPQESELIPLYTPDDIKNGNTLFLAVKENLSMSEQPHLVEFGTFELALSEPLADEYQCKLKVNPKGEIEAFCLVNDQWIRMGFTL